MKEQYNNFFDAIINLIETVHVKLITIIVFIDAIRHFDNLPPLMLILRLAALSIALCAIFYCLLQAAAHWHPRWFDIDQVMEDFNLEVSYGVLDGVDDNPDQNGKFWEYDFVSCNEEDNELYASLIVDGRDGLVVGLAFPYEEERFRAVMQFGPSFGSHPAILIGKIDENGPEVWIEEELAIILTHALRASDPKNAKESERANRSYYERNCYGAARCRSYVSIGRAKTSYPTSHDNKVFRRNE